MYQRRWVMYCRYANLPLEWESHGSGVNFILWITNKWREFGALVGISENERPLYHNQFDRWLLEHAPQVTNE